MAAMTPASRVELLTRACASTSSILEAVHPGQLALSTPCRDWSVGDLIEHIVRTADFFGDLAERGSSPEEREWPTYADGDFLGSFGEQARRVLAGFSTAGAMKRLMVLPTGPAPGSRCIQVATGEIFVHGWDLAKATTRAMPPDPGLADAVLSSDWPSMCAAVRRDHPSVFAPEIRVSPERPAIDRLVGFVGRDPGWLAAQ
jgi:uncharacterized protein (TIGR03086 family)